MNQNSSTDVKERIRHQVDIVELINSYIALRRQGNMYVGICPFHDDSKPSLQIRPDRQTWKCWVCGDKGGDIFSWVMEKEKVDFREALKLLADKAGVVLETNERKIAPGSIDDKKTLLDCCAWAEKLFHEYLLTNEAAEIARQYYEERGITPASVEQFKLGFAPNEWSWLIDRARRTPFTPQILEAVGLVGRSASTNNLYDRFKGRVIFPIHDAQGRCIAFGGRVLPQWANEQAAKYINSPETKLFSKSEQLYALDIARNHINKSRALTVVEGYTDVVMCHQHGVNDVVACLGTALGPRHIQLIKRFADHVYLVLDGDAAGQRRTNEILDLFVGAQVDLRILTLPEEFDPCEFLLERSADEWRTMLETQAVDAVEHRIRSASAGLDKLNDTYAANQALEEILRTVAQAPKPTLTSASQQALREKQIISRLAREFAVDNASLEQRIAELRTANKPNTDLVSLPAPAPATYNPTQLLPTEAELIELLARHPELAPTALAEISDDELSSPGIRIIFQTYRRLEETGDSLEFGRVLSELEDVPLQSLLVALDEQAERKQQKSLQDPPTRMRGVIRFYQRRHEELQRRETEAALAKRRFDEEEEKNLLQQMLQTKRQQQGIIAPTEG